MFWTISVCVEKYIFESDGIGWMLASAWKHTFLQSVGTVSFSVKAYIFQSADTSEMVEVLDA